MKFQDAHEKQAYFRRQWQDNRGVAIGFSFIIFLHTCYLLFVYLFFQVHFTVYLSIILFGVFFPVSVMIVVLSFMRPLKWRFMRFLWYSSITVASVMVGAGLAGRSLLCIYRIENPVDCTAENSPISNSEISVVYILMGPFLVLNILRNDLRYQLVGIVLMLAVVIWAVFAVAPPTMLTYWAIIFVIGAQLMGILVQRVRNKVEMERFRSEVNNTRLSRSLAEEVVEKTKAQQKAQEEENRRTQFTNMLFHEIRVPLNSVVLSIDDLDEVCDNPDSRDNLDRIKNGMNAIINTINDSLDYRKMTEGKLQIVEKPFGYIEMVEHVLRNMEPSWKAKELQLEADYDERIRDISFKLLGDANRLSQVLANYLSNAIKFTEPNGRIQLKVQLVDVMDDKIEIYTHVRDNGVGIEKEDQEKLFAPFVQIDAEKLQQGKGSGLGLSIVANIIRSMNGKYGVVSEYGQGSTFWFTVELTVTDIPKTFAVERKEPSKDLNHIVARKALHILVTDDDSATRKIMRRILEKMGHSVEEAEDGMICIEKMEQASQTGDPYDVLFIDNLMPRMTGLDAIRHLRTSYRLPIVSLTGSSDMTTTKELSDAGATRVLMKPSSLQMIKEVLGSVAGM